MMKSFLMWLAYELIRLFACLATVALWLALMILCMPDAPASTMAVHTRDCGPMIRRSAPIKPMHPLALSAPSVQSRSHRQPSGRLARITVYAPDEPRSDYWTRRRRSATGVRLKPGHCAVDPRRIPYGSTVIVAGRKFLAVDCGGFRGWHVDVFFDRWRDAIRFDRSTPDRLPITVIKPRT
jgi:3D (Asp-Asp-Asp) domain-containing protein